MNEPIEPMSGPRLWKYEPEPTLPPPPPQMVTPPPPPTPRGQTKDLISEASECAMDMICGVTCNNAGLYDQMRAVRRITYAWVNTPEKLLEAETVDDLPEIR